MASTPRQVLGAFLRSDGAITDVDQRAHLLNRCEEELVKARQSRLCGDRKRFFVNLKWAATWRSQAMNAEHVTPLPDDEQNRLCGDLGFHVDPSMRFDPSLAKV